MKSINQRASSDISHKYSFVFGRAVYTGTVVNVEAEFSITGKFKLKAEARRGNCIFPNTPTVT